MTPAKDVPISIPGVPGRVTSRGREDFAGGVKAPEMGRTLDSPRGLVSSQGPYKREAGGGGQRQRETGDAALLAVRMQEGPRARDAAPLEAGKGGNRCSPGASGRNKAQ